MEISKTGIFTMLGRPNVGKSTLTNALVGEKVTIVSDKPQTTRNRICGIVPYRDAQFIFADTPGFHKPKNKLGEYMVSVVNESMEDTDAAILVVEPQSPGKQERLLIERMTALGIPMILVINKVDAADKASLLGVIEHYAALGEFVTVVPLSARTGDGVEILREELYKLCQDGPALYEEGIFSDQSERVMAAEFIREKLLRLLDREVPHGIAVDIEKFDESNEAYTEIGAVIYCEKTSHKGIVIGKNGAMLKKVGQYAREDMEKLLGKKVFLTLWVKIREDWRDDGYSIRDFGYE